MSDKLQSGILAGSTSLSTVIILRSTTDNTETTGKVASNMTGSYLRQGGVRVSISLSDLAAVNSSYSSGGVKEIDSTNQPGLYRLDIPDAAIATGADWVTISIKVSGCYVFHERFSLTTNVVQTGDSFARIGSAGAGLTGITVVGSVTSRVTANTDRWNGGVIPTVNVTGVPIVDLGYSLGTAVTNKDGTATAGSASTITLQSGASTSNNFYNGQYITIVGGTGIGQSRVISGYVGGTLVATVVPNWTTTPDNTSQYILGDSTGNLNSNTTAIGGVAAAASNLSAAYAGFTVGTATAGASGTITLAVGSNAVNDFYKNQAIFITSGTGAGQTNNISAYVGSTRVASVETTWATTVDNTSVYMILGRIG